VIPIYQIKDREELRSRLAKRQFQRSGKINREVRRILTQVQEQGDEALISLTEKFDGVAMTPRQLRASRRDIRGSAAKADPVVVRELEKAIFNIHAYHSRQREKSWEFAERGVVLGQRVLPLDSVGVYVPGGSAAYPSSVLMNVIPAKIAGVPRIVVSTPPLTFQQHPIIAAAIQELNIGEVYLMGGAQAIGALAYGTETIPRVDKIVGPGNAYVAAAKKEVFGEVDIDMIAGPSEVVILSTAESNPRYIAADMLSQAEHDPSACAVCFTDSTAHAVLIQQELKMQLRTLPRRQIARRALQKFGALVIVEDHFQAAEWINEMAPEHLEIFSSVPMAVVDLIRNVGAIFYGDYSPEAVGDYFAGSNHVLPTGGTARFSSPLGVYDFQRRTSIVRYSREELARTWRSIDALARAEGLEGHARSVRVRQMPETTPSGVT
jgi:histidinol dehydrogenase